MEPSAPIIPSSQAQQAVTPPSGVPVTPPPSSDRSGKKINLWLPILILLLIALVSGGMFFISKKKALLTNSTSQNLSKVTSSPTPELIKDDLQESFVNLDPQLSSIDNDLKNSEIIISEQADLSQ